MAYIGFLYNISNSATAIEREVVTLMPNMPKEATYTHARENLASLWDEVTENQEIVIIHRRGAKDIAMIDADELRSLMETAHLLRSPKNAERLVVALGRALSNEGVAMSVEQLRQQVGLTGVAGTEAETGTDAKAS